MRVNEYTPSFARAVTRDDSIGRIGRADVEPWLEVRDRRQHRKTVQRLDLLPRVIPGEASAHQDNIGVNCRGA